MTEDRARLVITEGIFLMFAIAVLGGLYPVYSTLLADAVGDMDAMTQVAYTLLGAVGILVILGYIYMESVGGFR